MTPKTQTNSNYNVSNVEFLDHPLALKQRDKKANVNMSAIVWLQVGKVIVFLKLENCLIVYRLVRLCAISYRIYINKVFYNIQNKQSKYLTALS